jgi:hypothetical protein
MSSRKHVSTVFISTILVFFVLIGITAPPTPKDNKSIKPDTKLVATSSTPVIKEIKIEKVAQPVVVASSTEKKQLTKEEAQKKLNDYMALAKRAKIVNSYDFAHDDVIYADYMWYDMTFLQKKDFLTLVSIYKEKSSGYHRVEVKDAYSGELVGEVTAFSGSVEVYK